MHAYLLEHAYTYTNRYDYVKDVMTAALDEAMEEVRLSATLSERVTVYFRVSNFASILQLFLIFRITHARTHALSHEHARTLTFR